MTMFSKGTWTIFKVQQPDNSKITLSDAFKNTIENLGTEYIPLFSINKTLHEQVTSIGLSPFSEPRLGDEEEVLQLLPKSASSSEDMASFQTNNTLSEWEYNPKSREFTNGTITIPMEPYWTPEADKWAISPGVYGAWMMLFEYIDAHDAASKKEKIAYDYGAPFKLQSGEVKKSIVEAVSDLNTFTRKHFQLVFDFNSQLIWINTASKPVIEQALRVFETLGLTVSTPELADFIDEDVEILNKILTTDLYEASSIQDEVTLRLDQVKRNGEDGVEPHENASMEKILKAYCALTERDGYQIGMSSPMSIVLTPNLSATSVKSNYETTELMQSNESATIAEASLTFSEYIEKMAKNGEVKRSLIKRFSILATPNIHLKDLPGLIVRGVNVEDFKSTVKQHVKATNEQPSIAEFWSMYYSSLKTSVYVYFQTMKDAI